MQKPELFSFIPGDKRWSLKNNIVKFFVFLVVMSSLGSAFNQDLCEHYGGTEIMQTDWADCPKDN